MMQISAVEPRRAPRRSAAHPAQIDIARTLRDCVVRELSDVCARTAVDHPDEVPSKFRLVTMTDNCNCHNMWHDNDAIGVILD